jgi:hypothetical protein
MASRSIAMNPVGAVLAGLVIAGAVIVRLGTGKSFGTIGEEVNEMFLGDYDEEVRAGANVRDQIRSNSALSTLASLSDETDEQGNKVVPQDIVTVYKAAAARKKRGLVGASRLRRAGDMQVQGIPDMVILYIARKWKELWRSSDSPQKLERIRKVIEAAAGGDAAGGR